MNMIKLCNDFNDLFSTNFFKMEDEMFGTGQKTSELPTKIYMDEKKYVIFVNIYNAKTEDLKITYNEDKLKITINLKEFNQEKMTCLYSNFPTGNIEKTITLKNIDKNKITATIENNLLKITAPKRLSNDDEIKITIE